MTSYQELIQHILNTPQEKLTLDLVKQLKREFSKKHKLKDVVSNIKILREYHKLVKTGKIQRNSTFEQLMKKRAIRSQSGIVSVQVLTKPFPCPGKCIFCPNDPEMPKSYIKSEPGAMRAWLNQFDPYKQVWNRLLSLTLTGHETDKIEMIVLGGTWDVYPKDYKIEFIKGLYDACNSFPEYFKRVQLPDEVDDESKIKYRDEDKAKKFAYHVEDVDSIPRTDSVQEAIKSNESAAHRIIGLTVETRPEFVTDDNCKFWRELGVTRIEMGIQSMYDEVLEANKRGHNVEAIRKALHKLRQYAFKFSVHLMPGLYKSTIKKDIGTFEKVFSDPSVKPDELKFYPTSVIPNTELNDLYEAGKYKPLSTEDIQKIIKKVLLSKIPAYTRIKRLIRDIPSTEIVAGSKVTNLSQLTRKDLSKQVTDSKQAKARKKLYSRLYPKAKNYSDLEAFFAAEITRKAPKGKVTQTFLIHLEPDISSARNFVSLDTRSREIRNKYGDWRLKGMKDEKGKNEEYGIVIRRYASSVGIEYFISIEDKFGYLYGFTRLLLPQIEHTIERDGLGADTALIRELHVYGQLETIKKSDRNNEDNKVQHTGFGKQLMQTAETISKNHNYKRLSVISGVGVRKYYEKLGYTLDGTYMVKSLSHKSLT